jgi:hypothetical protein
LAFIPDDHLVGTLDGIWRAERIVATLFLIVATFSIIGQCVQASDGWYTAPAGQASQGVIFLEHNLVANGTVVNGTAPFRSVNFPSYWFNENTRQLNGDIGFAIDRSLVMIFGDTLALRGNFGAGTGNKLYGVYQLPVRAAEATVYYTDPFGNIGMYVNNRTVYLQPGENYTYNETEVVKDGSGVIRIAYEHRYINHGPIEPGAIQSRMVPA